MNGLDVEDAFGTLFFLNPRFGHKTLVCTDSFVHPSLYLALGCHDPWLLGEIKFSIPSLKVRDSNLYLLHQSCLCLACNP